MLINAIDFTLPLTNPVLKFFIILVIILSAPILLNKIKIPHLLGLIIAGTVIGPFGFNLLQRDSGIDENSEVDLRNPSLIKPIEQLDEIGKTIIHLFNLK